MKTKIMDFIVKSTGNKQITEDENFFEKGYASSLLAMQIVSYLENEFNIIVENDEMQIENFNSIQNIFSFVSEKVKE